MRTCPLYLKFAQLVVLLLAVGLHAETVLIQDGKGLADIVIAEDAPATTRLAAKELQSYLAKLSGATLPIHTRHDPHLSALYVGVSEATTKLGLTTSELHYGAFRIAAGDGWAALLGPDSDFVPKKPYAANHNDVPRMLKEWDKVSGGTWDNPTVQTFKRYNPELGIWDCAERSSLNAVYEFLRRQGVRWYMPGDLGEVVPAKPTISITAGNQVIRPDFPLRHWHVAQFHMAPTDHILWTLRQGLNHGTEVTGFGPMGHGIAEVHSRPETKEAHPEYYGLFGGERDTFYGKAGRPCLSSEGLLQENIKYARAVLDTYDEPMLSVMPQDGYSTVCQCPLCAGKGSPERGWYGAMSDYVYTYIEKVAAELYKTHPDKKLSCFAYGTYQLPPTTIKRFSPNVVLGIVQSRATHVDPARRRQTEELRQAAQTMTSNKFLIWDYYLHSREQSTYHGLPVYFPHAISQDLKAVKGKTYGDFLEVSFGKNLSIHAPIFNHLNLWITARLYWDADANVDDMLAEYYHDFYGPAADAMKAFVDYSEPNWMDMSKDPVKLEKALGLLASVQAAAPAGSIYGKRIAELVDYFKPMAPLRERLLHTRDDAMEVVAGDRETATITLDGNLDEPFWQGLTEYPLSQIETGEPPVGASSVKLAWKDGNLYFGITCQDPDMSTVRNAVTRHDDANIWAGDCVEILIESQVHSYYQIAISPGGAVTDLDRQHGLDVNWSSDIEVVTHNTDGAWIVEARLPIAPVDQNDPNNLVTGSRPTADAPFYLNVCRQRLRERIPEWTGVARVGENNFHVPLKFAKLTIQ